MSGTSDKDRSAETNGETPEEIELDEIDRFLSTLHVPENMVKDPDRPSPVLLPPEKVSITGVFAVVAWVFLLITVLTILRAIPKNASFFNHLLSRYGVNAWDRQILFTAMCYAFGNCAVSAGGLAICRIKKLKMSAGKAVSLWITAVLSLIFSIALLMAQ